MLESFWWGSVFLLAVPVMVLLLAVGPRLLPEQRDPEAGRLDLASAGLSLLALLAVVYGVKAFASDGASWAALAPVLAGVLAGTAFVDRQRRLAEPMIDLGLFRERAFSTALGANTLGFAVVFGLEIFVAQYLQLVLGYSPLAAGAWSVPAAAAFVVGSQLTTPLVARFRPASVMLGGLLVALAGVAALTQAGTAGGPLLLVGGAVVMSLGFAPLFTLAADLAVSSAPPERAGAASGISETSSELGGALGIALLGTVGAAVYRAETGGPDTLGGAVEAAGRLPESARADLLEPAREAFTQGLQVAATLSGAIVVAATLLVAKGLWRPARRTTAAAVSPCA
jgi:DHA2 family multidrug resistance protein-like MFS transporter